MDKKKIAIGIIAIIVIIAIIGIVGVNLFINNMDLTLEGTTAKVTLPKDYTLNEKGLATKGNVGMYFIEMAGDTSITTDFLKAIKSGYENYSESTANGYKIYEYSAKPNNLKLLKYGSSTKWTEYPPQNLTSPADSSRITCDHYRTIYYLSPNGATISQLVIYTTDANTDLKTAEINDIINSIKPKENN